ncbi:MAG: CoA pyrophosphatase, partial [Rickettsiales bacterium]|nr:CoA pyrophosphatase [Rickettsiales bacterium]
DNEPALLITRRTSTLGAWPSVLSHAGGKIEPGESFYTASIRELIEEVGLPTLQIVEKLPNIYLFGTLPPRYIPPHNPKNVDRLSPVVAILNPKITPDMLTASASEVAEILSVPIATLFNPENFEYFANPNTQLNEVMQCPVIRINKKDTLWGVTATIVKDLYQEFGADEHSINRLKSAINQRLDKTTLTPLQHDNKSATFCESVKARLSKSPGEWFR